MQAPADPTSDTPPPRSRRAGRPSAEQAGDVDRRILDAATDLFLKLGFDATSCEQVVVQAGAGKASLYARYANKEELFGAVARRMLNDAPLLRAEVPWHLSRHERLRAVGQALLAHALDTERLALMRVAMSVAHRMPELVQLADRTGRDVGTRSAALAIAGRDATPEDLDRASPAAHLLVDLMLAAPQMRALAGGDPEQLRAEAMRRIDTVIGLLLESD